MVGADDVSFPHQASSPVFAEGADGYELDPAGGVNETGHDGIADRGVADQVVLGGKAGTDW